MDSAPHSLLPSHPSNIHKMPLLFLSSHSVPSIFSVSEPPCTPKEIQLRENDIHESTSQISVDDNIKSSLTIQGSEKDVRMSLHARSLIMGSNCDESIPKLKDRSPGSPYRAIEKNRKTGSYRRPNSSANFREYRPFQRCIEVPVDGDEESSKFIIRKKAFILSLMETCSTSGCLTCRLCRVTIWGPNGMVLQLPASRASKLQY